MESDTLPREARGPNCHPGMGPGQLRLERRRADRHGRKVAALRLLSGVDQSVRRLGSHERKPSELICPGIASPIVRRKQWWVGGFAVGRHPPGKDVQPLPNARAAAHKSRCVENRTVRRTAIA